MEKRLSEFLIDKNIENAVKHISTTKDLKNIHLVEHLNHSTKKIQLPNTPNPIIYKHTDVPTAIGGTASSKMYNDIGILSPQIHLLKSKNTTRATTFQQDVSSIDFLDTILADENYEYSQIVHEFFGKDKWAIFYDTNLVRRFLHFMTHDCLEQLKNLFLIDELRTDCDRHTKNYFFYKQKGSTKYEGIIAIDLDLMTILHLCDSSKDAFSNFLVTPYESATPQQKYDHICYMQRVKDVRELIQDGVLSQKNLETLMGALKHNFPADIKRLTKDKGLHGKAKKNIVDPIERLWEYNQNTIGKDLGL